MVPLGVIQGVHIVEVGAPGDICDGVLLVLDAGPRIPGFPVIHTNELQDGELYYNRGRVLLLLGRLDEANKDFGEAMRLNATHPHFPHYKGMMSSSMHSKNPKEILHKVSKRAFPQM